MSPVSHLLGCMSLGDTCMQHLVGCQRWVRGRGPHWKDTPGFGDLAQPGRRRADRKSRIGVERGRDMMLQMWREEEPAEER